ncbi:MAG: FkbM family methyltransferase [Chitinophagaceae bacterium]|nr:FkbM family methyltransferase [Chitinophagaceae bacterium]
MLRRITRSLKDSVPSFIKDPINQWRNKTRWANQYRAIITFYKNKENIEADEKEVLDYLIEHPGLTIYPYKYVSSWDYKSVKVFLDEETALRYVIHNGYKLFFRRSSSEEEIMGTYFGLVNEQRAESPHLYLTDDFQVNEGDVVADIGAAEGIFTLNCIEKVSKAYLFEPSTEWIEALEATFKPWKEKIIIVNKYVSDFISDSVTSIDHYFSNKHLHFIKADVEGAELSVLKGASSLLEKSSPIKLCICTYHNQDDFDNISEFLSTFKKFKISHSRGFMLFFIFNNLKPPYLRRGILRAIHE